MDNHSSAVFRETILRETKLSARHSSNARQTVPGTPRQSLGTPRQPLVTTRGSLPAVRKQTAADRQLDQTMGLTKDPYAMTKEEIADHGVTAEDFFRWGVSHDGQGRRAYLKQQVKAGGPQERFGHPTLSSHDVGWMAPSCQSFATSQYARRPRVKSDFFRTSGVDFSRGPA